MTVTLSPSDGGAGVAATYYTTDGSTPTTSSSQGTSIDLTSNGVYTIKYFSVDRVGNTEPVETAGTQIRIDLTSPTSPALTLSESSPYAHVIGTTVYVKSGQTGTYTVAATSNDPLSGIDKIRFPGGVDDSASPYQTIYALDDLTGTQTVTAYDNAGNTSSSTFDVTTDDVAPSGGSVSYADGYDSDGQIPVSTSNGTDALSGVDASTGVLERRTSALTDGSCAGFSGGWTAVSSPDTVATDTCAQYRYRVSDHVSNEVVYTSANVVKVDQTAPNTSIGSTPNDPTNATGATFTFSATETGSTFECELDGGGFTSCTSPEGYAGLAEGSHTFKVRATDVAGNTDASPAQFTWTVDTSAPNTSIGSTPNDPTNATGATFTFSLDRDRLDVRVRARRRRLLELLEPEELRGPRRRQPHVQGARHRPGREHGRLPGAVHVDGRHRGPEHGHRRLPARPRLEPEPVLRVLLDRGRLHLRVRARRRRLLQLLEPEELRGPRRRQPHVQGARHRRGREHGRDAGFLHVGRERRRPERLDHRAERVREPRRRRPVHRHGHEP